MQLLCSAKCRKLTLLDILPIYHLALESPTHSLVDAALKCLPIVLPVLDFSTVKHDLFPVIATVFSKTSSLAIKIRGLEAFVALCGGSMSESVSDDGLSGILEEQKPVKAATTTGLDKFTVQEKVVPLLKAIKTKEPAVMMAALRVFQQVCKVSDADFLALEVLPTLWNFSLGPLLNLEQFKRFMGLIKTVSSRIEQEQIRKLQELSSSGRSATSNRAAVNASAGAMNGFPGSITTNGAEDDFERLVLGKKGNDAISLGDEWSPNTGGVLEPQVQGGGMSTAGFGRASSNILQQSKQPTSRSVTPDSSMASFPSLQPSSNLTSPLNSAFVATQPATPSWGTQNTTINPPSAPRMVSNPTIATLGSLRSPPLATSSASSAFSIPPPPSSAGNFGQFPMQPVTSPPVQPPIQPRYGGGLGGGTATTGNSNTFTQSNHAPARQGLDKYESLL